MTTLHEFTARTLSGEDRALGDYRGQVVLVVNTASACGFTPQYAGLQALHERFPLYGFDEHKGYSTPDHLHAYISILSMKAASLTAHAHDAGKTRTQGLAFLAGVVATFLVLAGLLIAVRAGAQTGWLDQAWRKSIPLAASASTPLIGKKPSWVAKCASTGQCGVRLISASLVEPPP